MGRPSRSFRIRLANETLITWLRVDMGLEWGIWSNDGSEVPPETIEAKHMAEWSSESMGFATGTQGHVSYESIDGLHLRILWDNPFVGSNHLSADKSDGLLVVNTSISGDNADVLITVTNPGHIE